MLAWLLVSLALAGESVSEADLDIVVTAEHDVAVARAALYDGVRDLGYLPGVQLGDQTVFVPIKRWKPRIVVWDDGRVRAIGSALTPLFVSISPAYIEVSGLWGTRRQARQNEDDALRALRPLVVRYEAALASRALAVRIEEVGQRLEQAWAGVARDGTTLPTPELRRAEIVAMWLHTADNDAGAQVRQRIERFAAEVVQESASPFAREEIEAANARRGFVDEWSLPE